MPSPAALPSGTGALPPAIDRRGFLRTSAGGTAAIALASLVPAGCAADYPQADADRVELRALTPKEYAVACAAAEALLGTGVPVPPAQLAATIDRELALIGDPVRRDLRTVLVLLEHLTLLGGRMRRFTALAPAERLAYLDGWRHSRMNLRRAAFQALHAFVYFFAYADPVTRPLTGFPGPWTERLAIPAYPVDFGEIA